MNNKKWIRVFNENELSIEPELINFIRRLPKDIRKYVLKPYLEIDPNDLDWLTSNGYLCIKYFKSDYHIVEYNHKGDAEIDYMEHTFMYNSINITKYCISHIGSWLQHLYLDRIISAVNKESYYDDNMYTKYNTRFISYYKILDVINIGIMWKNKPNYFDIFYPLFCSKYFNDKSKHTFIQSIYKSKNNFNILLDVFNKLNKQGSNFKKLNTKSQSIQIINTVIQRLFDLNKLRFIHDFIGNRNLLYIRITYIMVPVETTQKASEVFNNNKNLEWNSTITTDNSCYNNDRWCKPQDIDLSFNHKYFEHCRYPDKIMCEIYKKHGMTHSQIKSAIYRESVLDVDI